MFDRVEISVIAGRGGDGIVSFRREKFVPLGGPDGGDGGDGGDVVIKVDKNIASLIGLQNKSVYMARNGSNGRSQKRRGRSGNDLILSVPVGVTITGKKQMGDNLEIHDLTEPGQQVIIAAGGCGGLGNTHFVSSTNQAPQIAQKGEFGEKKELILELKLIADVGIIGYPNVGKSSLLAVASAAKPKIANYPFTTLEPVLGSIEVDQRSFILAEIPGLISGAHMGRGLGHDFLRHVLRTKILIHLIDGSSTSPIEDMVGVNSEISLFDSGLSQKPQLVAVNKIDLPDVRNRLTELKDAFSRVGIDPFFISAVTGEGVPVLMQKVLKALEESDARRVADSGATAKVFHPKPKGFKIKASREGDTFVLIAAALERIIEGTDLTNPEARRQLNRWLYQPAVRKALEKVGIKPGNKVRCGILDWRW
ncbi:MAG: GTPase ObgE [Dehalococcoidia bacterium]|nr:MAG: GTPase ObgE [Dehalococcoidia bacterium]